MKHLTTTLEVLENGLEQVKERWGQGEFWYKDRFSRLRCCMLGAIGVDYEGLSPFCTPGRVKVKAENALCRALGRKTIGLTAFNDASETTKADVVALFERAIEAERASEKRVQGGEAK